MPKVYKSQQELDEAQKKKQIEEEVKQYEALGFDVKNVKLPQEDKAEDSDMLNFKGYNWHKIWPVPSMCKWYPEGTKIYGKSMTLLDIKLLATMQEKNADEITRAVIQRNVYIPAMPDIKELCIQDRMFIIFWLRQQTFTDNVYATSYDCPECGTENELRLEITKMKIQPVPENLEVTMTVDTGEVLTFAPTRDKDQEFIERLLPQNDPEKSGMDEYLMRAFATVKYINGNACNLGNVRDVLAKNVKNFGHFIKLAYAIDNWGPDNTIDHTCIKCGRLTNVSVSFPTDFYLPGYNS